MNSSNVFSRSTRFATRRIGSLFVAAASMFALAVTAQAQSNTVLYSPLSTVVEGPMPLVQTYSLGIRAPNTFPTGTNATVSLDLSVLSFSVGDSPTAATYVTFVSPSTGLPVTSLTFNAANQTVFVDVRVSIPLLGLSGAATSANFAYQIKTSGWPALVGGAALSDGGTFINAVASIPPGSDPNRLPPVVTVTTPTDGQIFTVSSLPTTINATFLATARTGFGITGVDGSLNGVPVAVSSTANADSTSVSGTASLVITSAGAYNFRANAHNSVGDATDVNAFSVVLNSAPPVAAIASPVNGSNYTVRAGSTGVSVPFNFSGTSTTSNIAAFNVSIDNSLFTSYTTTAFGQPNVTGATSLAYTTGGVHTITVEAIDTNGARSTVQTTTFTVNYVAPTPVASVALPNGTSYTIPTGSTTYASIPFTISSTADNNFNVDTVTATLDGTPVSLTSHTPALGSAGAVTSTGTLTNVSAGTHVLTVRCGSVGVLSQPASINFTVTSPVVQPPPTVVINTPAVGSTYTLNSGGSLSIPLTFTGTSNATGGVITQLTATLNSTPLTVTSTNLNQPVANGAATMVVTTAGTHSITVTARDAVGTATATRTFTVTVGVPRSVCGSVFFDADADGYEDCAEFGLSGVTVRILNSTGAVVGTATTNTCGQYSFSGIYAGTYSVTVTPPAGFKATTVATRSITVSNCNVCVPDFGLGLDFTAMRTMTANGFTIGYWKNNLDKAISGKTSGIQVPAATLISYTGKIGDLALSPYDCISMKKASDTMGSTSSAAKDLLSKQLVASEYNYCNGAYLNGNKTLTYCFIWWGENVLKNYTSYTSTSLIWAKDWFDAYNNSHGGVVAGPAP